jgi:hypothetical protein
MAHWDKKQLIGLIQDLYALNKTNADFLNTRLLGGDTSLEPYKRRIQQAVSPEEPWKQDVRLAEGRKAISEYRKAKGDAHGLLSLMIHYVRCGNDFTLEFGDIDEPFYNSMCSMVDQFCKLLIKQGDTKLVKKFVPQLEKEFQRIDGQIGWGYPDEVGGQLSDLSDAFEGML